MTLPALLQKAASVNIDLRNSATPQLYDVANDPGEKSNVAATHPPKVEELKALPVQARGT